MQYKSGEVKLTQFSHGAGCGCKISPKVLTSILKTELTTMLNPMLLVGNDSRDDAAVLDLGDGTAIISTTDFFMPIVDDPFTFGKIAAANAISDVYAMGGTPILAIAILGWPVNKLAPEIAQKVLDGGRSICEEAGITLAGGHSIDSPEPIFGLAVTGRVNISNLKKNDTASAGCKLLLTKPLGVGILSTAQKKGVLKEEHSEIAPNLMCGLNKIGKQLAEIPGVKAITDVTGFGLLGHLSEMCEGSKLSAKISFSKVPKLEMLEEYLKLNCIPGGTLRNWESYGSKIKLENEDWKNILADPQTSGGLLIAVEPESELAVQEMLLKNTIKSEVFGDLVIQEEYLVSVEN
jgi:selenide,water dikinase